MFTVQDTASIQEVPASSTASTAISDAKHVINKSVKQEDGKGESAGPAVSNIPAEALNRLIAMGGAPGELVLLLLCC